MSAPYKNLKQYFEAAKAQEPIVALDELKIVLQQSPISPTPGVKALAAGRKQSWIAGGASMLAVASTIIWLALSQESGGTKSKATGGTATSKKTEIKSKVIKRSATSSEDGHKIVSLTQVQTLKVTNKGNGADSETTPRGTIYLQGEHAIYHPSKKQLTISANASLSDRREREKIFDKITLLELPRQIEEKLGIKINDKGILYEGASQDSVEGLVGLIISIYGGEHSLLVGRLNRAEQLFKAGAAFLPLYVSDRNGERKVMYRTDGEDARKFKPEYFNEKLNTMIPVLVKANNPAKDEAVFWFSATPEFLNLLPKPLSLDIAKEYQQLAEQKQNSTDTLQKPLAIARSAETQLKYFESNPGSLSSIQYAVVFPNPVSDILNLSMSLKREEEMRISLVDINGRLVKVLLPFKHYPAGAVTEKLQLNKEASGLYLLLTETRSGHTHTQRIIIE